MIGARLRRSGGRGTLQSLCLQSLRYWLVVGATERSPCLSSVTGRWQMLGC